MANTFIYIGLGIMLIGAVYEFFVAVKGYHSSKGQWWQRFQLNAFYQGPPDPKMRRLIKIWMLIMITGFAFTGIGISIGLG